MSSRPQRPKRYGRSPQTRKESLYPTSNHSGAKRVNFYSACGKVRFRERNDAKDALTAAAYARASCTPDRPTRRQEVRTYWCQDCMGWHLTSRPEFTPETASVTASISSKGGDFYGIHSTRHSDAG